MKKRILNQTRIRAIQGGFAFVPHRFLKDGFIKRLDPEELLLYLFLIMVSDAYGLSYYGDSSLCRLLKMDPGELERCRQSLIDEDLIAFESPLYQVLELPPKPSGEKQLTGSSPGSSLAPSSFSELKQRLEEKR